MEKGDSLECHKCIRPYFLKACSSNSWGEAPPRSPLKSALTHSKAGALLYYCSPTSSPQLPSARASMSRPHSVSARQSAWKHGNLSWENHIMILVKQYYRPWVFMMKRAIFWWLVLVPPLCQPLDLGEYTLSDDAPHQIAAPLIIKVCVRKLLPLPIWYLKEGV